MNVTTRLMSALLVAALLALPGVGSEGGENAGGTGVWILPRASFVSTSVTTQIPTVPLARALVSSDVSLTTSVEMGACTATLVDDVSGAPLSLPTNGRNVVLTRTVMENLVASGCTSCHIVIADASQLGYVVRLVLDAATSSVTISLH